MSQTEDELNRTEQSLSSPFFLLYSWLKSNIFETSLPLSLSVVGRYGSSAVEGHPRGLDRVCRSRWRFARTRPPASLGNWGILLLCIFAQGRAKDRLLSCMQIIVRPWLFDRNKAGIFKQGTSLSLSIYQFAIIIGWRALLVYVPLLCSPAFRALQGRAAGMIHHQYKVLLTGSSFQTKSLLIFLRVLYVN